MDDLLPLNHYKVGWVRKIFRFLYLTFYQLPMKEERQKNVTQYNQVFPIGIAVGLMFCGIGYIGDKAYEFPKVSELSHIQGVVSGYNKSQLTKGVSTQVFIDSGTQKYITWCGYKGRNCLLNMEKVEGKNVQAYIDKDSHLISLWLNEIELIKYKREKSRVFTTVGTGMYLAIFVLIWGVCSFARRYAKTAFSLTYRSN